MLAKSSRRVVIINNIKSDKIEQAIFILRGNSEAKPDRFIVREAQEIIDNYIKRVDSSHLSEAISYSPSAVKERRKWKIGAGFLTLFLLAGLLSLIFLIKAFSG